MKKTQKKIQKRGNEGYFFFFFTRTYRVWVFVISVIKKINEKFCLKRKKNSNLFKRKNKSKTMSLSLFFLTIAVMAVTAAHAAESINLTARGIPFAGVGAQSTAGSARLLIDYQEPQRSQILDFLFKPSFGASLQHLKVEIGGDAQISCGAEASGQRTANGTDADWSVGYEGWLMAEAKKRNPDIPLLGLVYAWPEWVSPGGSSPFASPQTEANAASYMTNWVRGMSQQNLTIDWVGIWNEREFTVSYVVTLREALDAAGFTSTKIVGSDRFWDPYASAYMNSAALRNATAALSQHYPNCGPTGTGGQCPNAVSPNAVLAHKEYGIPLFSTEDYSCWSDDNAAVHWASKLNNNYIGGNITFYSVWYLATAFYPSVAFWNDGLLRATQPWGGHYELSPTVWATAHYTQFTEPTGWYYLTQGRGSGTLPGGGTFVTLVDSLGNVTIVIEAAGEGLNPWSQQNCKASTTTQPRSRRTPRLCSPEVSSLTRSPSGAADSSAVAERCRTCSCVSLTWR